MDTLSLIESPRLTHFLPANLGRQSLWCYVLIPFVALFGAHPFALRLAAGFVGILTTVAVYQLGKETLSPRAARWALLVFCIAGWPVHQSGLGMRAVLWPLIGTLAFASLMQARRTNRMALWIEAGIWMGLLWYTYFSALLWILHAVVLLIGWLFGKTGQRRGSAGRPPNAGIRLPSPPGCPGTPPGSAGLQSGRTDRHRAGLGPGLVLPQMIVPKIPAVYVSVTLYEPDFQEKLSRRLPAPPDDGDSLRD